MFSTNDKLSRRAVALIGALAFVGCSSGGGGGGGGGGDTPPPAKKTTYKGTIYMASASGGHIVVVPVTIDPSNATTPFQLGTIKKMQLSAGFGTTNTTHNFHDVRLDGNTLYYSTIAKDANSQAHVGSIDLSGVDCSGAGLDCSFTNLDSVIDVNSGAAMIYCGSGQTTSHFVPMTMSYPAYIDAIAKSAITDGATLSSGTADVKRTLVHAFRADMDYHFAHGINNPDQDRLFVAVNDTEADRGGTAGGMSGSVTSYLLKMDDVVAGTVTESSVLVTSTVSGLSTGGVTTAFRSTFTPDGSKILQAGKDRLLVLHGDTLAELDNNTAIGGSFTGIENHDAMPTPDGKYAILALRFKHAPGDANQDSGLQLYDLAKQEAIGQPVSTCNTCHSASAKARLTCGIDAKLTAVTE